MVNWYIGPNGNDSGSGNSPLDPWLTPGANSGQVSPGDVVWLMDGVFQAGGGGFDISYQGTQGGYVTIRALNPGRCIVHNYAKLSSVNSNWSSVGGGAYESSGTWVPISDNWTSGRTSIFYGSDSPRPNPLVFYANDEDGGGPSSAGALVPGSFFLSTLDGGLTIRLPTEDDPTIAAPRDDVIYSDSPAFNLSGASYVAIQDIDFAYSCIHIGSEQFGTLSGDFLVSQCSFDSAGCFNIAVEGGDRWAVVDCSFGVCGSTVNHHGIKISEEVGGGNVFHHNIFGREATGEQKKLGDVPGETGGGSAGFHIDINIQSDNPSIKGNVFLSNNHQFNAVGGGVSLSKNSGSMVIGNAFYQGPTSEGTKETEAHAVVVDSREVTVENNEFYQMSYGVIHTSNGVNISCTDNSFYAAAIDSVTSGSPVFERNRFRWPQDAAPFSFMVDGAQVSAATWEQGAAIWAAFMGVSSYSAAMVEYLLPLRAETYLAEKYLGDRPNHAYWRKKQFGATNPSNFSSALKSKLEATEKKQARKKKTPERKPSFVRAEIARYLRTRK